MRNAACVTEIVRIHRVECLAGELRATICGFITTSMQPNECTWKQMEADVYLKTRGKLYCAHTLLITVTIQPITARRIWNEKLKRI